VVRVGLIEAGQGTADSFLPRAGRQAAVATLLPVESPEARQAQNQINFLENWLHRKVLRRYEASSGSNYATSSSKLGPDPFYASSAASSSRRESVMVKLSTPKTTSASVDPGSSPQ
jgi:hypothetical protein